jgi:hypothetical protein
MLEKNFSRKVHILSEILMLVCLFSLLLPVIQSFFTQIPNRKGYLHVKSKV